MSADGKVKSKKPKKFDKRAFAVATLRRASYRTRGRSDAFKQARVGRNQYKCNLCGVINPRQEIHMDHKIPVVDPLAPGPLDLNTFVDRLFVESDGYQCLCKPCHSDKSESENIVRRARKAFEKRKKENDRKA